MNSDTLTPLRYVIVTPVRDEAAYLPFTLQSVTRQTHLPAEWVIVNDGSTDQTGEIIDAYAQRFPWIRRVDRTDRGYRQCGGAIIEAFNSGYDALRTRDWDVLVKLDGDLSFPPGFFAAALHEFSEEPRLGIGGGTLFHIRDGREEIERCPKFHVRGGAKMFRRACWDQLDGLWVGYGSDTIDEVTANMHGWTTRSFPHLMMRHHRYTGASYGRWGSLVKDGKCDYMSGYHPLFMATKVIVRLARPPYLLGSLGLLCGFAAGYLQRMPRVGPEIRAYIRGQQRARLLGQPTIWK